MMIFTEMLSGVQYKENVIQKKKSNIQIFRNFFRKDERRFKAFCVFTEKIEVEDTVWKLWKFTVTFLWQKFRENNVFTKEITKELI